MGTKRKNTFESRIETAGERRASPPSGREGLLHLQEEEGRGVLLHLQIWLRPAESRMCTVNMCCEGCLHGDNIHSR